MEASEKEALYRLLSTIEDSVDGGYARPRIMPAFKDDSSPVAPATIDATTSSSAPIATNGPEEIRGTDSLDKIAADVSRCKTCRLGVRRLNAVPGMGVPDPLVLVIGEGPGAEEDAQGLPFVGPAGQLLDKMLESIELSREKNCFIANVVKCRPPGNRNPESDEVLACADFLSRQIAVLKPRFILIVGRVAAQTLLGTTEGINKLRGRSMEYKGIPLMATYHPSALLRDAALKRPTWEDLKAFKAMIDNA